MLLKLFHLINLLNCLMFLIETNALNIRLQKVKSCDIFQTYPMKLEFTSHGINKEIMLDGTATLPKDLDSTVMLNMAVEYSMTGAGYILILNETQSFCDFLNKYMANVWYKVDENPPNPVKSCPIIAGRYYSKNYKIPFDNLNFLAMPTRVAKLRITSTIQDNSNTILSCLTTEVRVEK